MATLAVTNLPQPADAQQPSVLRLARGLASNNISVQENRAVVIESAQPFLELSVAQPEIADVSPLSDRSIYVFGRRRGATTLTLLGENGQLITNVLIKVEPDIGELKTRISSVYPNEEIEIRAAGAGIILSGTVSSKAVLDQAVLLARAYAGEGVVNMLSVGGVQQVMLKARITEMSRTASKVLGVDILASGTINDDVGLFGVSGSQTSLNEEAQLFETALTSGNSILGIVAEFGDVAISALLQALEQKAFARTLAEPNLIALSGSEARFLVGSEFPIPVIGDDGETTVEFKPVGIGLNFRPRVIDGDLINLSLSAEVSAVEDVAAAEVGSVTIPSFTVRRATTTIELRDGQSFAIAGLIDDNFADAVSQTPILGDLPILGTLFRSADYTRGQSELVIIVTAHLVTPVDEDLLATPLDRVAIPNERDLFLLGNVEGPTSPGLLSGQEFDGDFGYVVE